MRVLVLGAGFLGQAITRAFHDRGHEAWMFIASGDRMIEHAAGAVKDMRPEAVILAAGAPRYRGFLGFMIDGEQVRAHVLLPAEIARLTRVVYLSSWLVYEGCPADQEADELTPAIPVSSYSILKCAGEASLKSDDLILRLGSVYQDLNDRNRGLLHWLVARASAGRELQVSPNDHLALIARSDLGRLVVRAVEAGVRGELNMAAWVGTAYELALAVTKAYPVRATLDLEAQTHRPRLSIRRLTQLFPDWVPEPLLKNMSAN